MDSTLQEDKKLLDFPTYEDYLDSLVTVEDLNYLRSTIHSRMIAELGYRSTSVTLSKSEFEKRKMAISEMVNPTRKSHMMASSGAKLDDPFLGELAARERSNRTGIISTIISMRHHTKTGFEISGYIDFEDSLRRAVSRDDTGVDWPGVFNSTVRLWPQTIDLGYYNRRTGYSACNDSANYKTLVDFENGLIFMNRHDRTEIVVDPMAAEPGSNTTRTVVESDMYDHVVLFDHVLRSKI